MRLGRGFVVWLALLSFVYGEANPLRGWTRAETPHEWSFPRDHGAHPEYKTEWWYFTGNLKSGNKHFGYQLTFFRQGIQHEVAQKSSRWALRDMYFGHFALTNVQRKQFRYAERLSRGSLGEAIASKEKMDVSMKDWKVEQIGPDAFRLSAEDPDQGIRLDLNLEASKPLVFQGPKGLSQKGPKKGNASHYYSYTRLKSTGQITWDQEVIEVSGSSWFDHEFSTSVLGSNQVGWDWFSIQLDNDEEIMVYQIRTSEGKKDPLSKGNWHAKGETTLLRSSDYEIRPIDSWTSPHNGTRYPAKWEILFSKQDARLEVTPMLADQELNLKGIADFSYWEGACRINGTVRGKPVTGYGYVEMTGYRSPIGFELKGN